jgi:diguanylate cyclase (GGDEF)-like protein
VAQRIARELRQDDLAARLGGDEFGVILCGVRDRDVVGTKCHSINSAIGAPFEFEGRALRLGASIGYAISPEDGQDMDLLIDLADQAMYRVKQARKAVAA